MDFVIPAVAYYRIPTWSKKAEERARFMLDFIGKYASDRNYTIIAEYIERTQGTSYGVPTLKSTIAFAVENNAAIVITDLSQLGRGQNGLDNLRMVIEAGITLETLRCTITADNVGRFSTPNMFDRESNAGQRRLETMLK